MSENMKKSIGESAGFSLERAEPNTEDADSGGRGAAGGSDPASKNRGAGARGFDGTIGSDCEVARAPKSDGAEEGARLRRGQIRE